MIIQNFRVILRLESENNTYEVMDPSWGKTNRFGYSRNFSKFSLLSHLFTQGALTLFKISKKFSEWILRGICNKMTHFWNKIFFQIIHYYIFSLHIVTYHQGIFRKNSLNRSWDPGESTVSPTYDKNDPFSDLETQSLPSK